MQIFKLTREIDADLKELSLSDILNRLESENFFSNSPAFCFLEKIDKNHLVFYTPRNKAVPREIYNFKYFPEKRKIIINGKYENFIFPCLITYLFPIFGLYAYLMSENQTTEQLIGLFWIFIGVSIYCGVIIFTGLNGSHHIEREISIRVNYLLREKGYRTGI